MVVDHEKQTLSLEGCRMITFPMERSDDGLYTIHGYVNGHAWVAYGRSREETLEHATVSRRMILHRIYKKHDHV